MAVSGAGSGGNTSVQNPSSQVTNSTTGSSSPVLSASTGGIVGGSSPVLKTGAGKNTIIYKVESNPTITKDAFDAISSSVNNALSGVTGALDKISTSQSAVVPQVVAADQKIAASTASGGATDVLGFLKQVVIAAVVLAAAWFVFKKKKT